jgi:PAS domain S-box-containing protein
MTEDREPNYRCLFESFPCPLLSLGPDGRVTDCNSALTQTICRPKEATVGRSLSEIGAFDQNELEEVEGLLSCAREGTAHPDVQLTLCGTGGARSRVEAFAIPILDGGELRSTILGFRKLSGRGDSDRERFEMALAESEERYRSLVESAREAIFTIDRNGTFLFMNEIAGRRLGGKASDFMGKTMWDLFPDHLAESQMQLVRNVIESGEGRLYETVTEIQGRECRYAASIEPIRDHSGTIVSAVGIARDITEVAGMQEALRNERDFVRSLLDTANSLIVCLDKEARIVVFNKECEKVTGYTREEVVGRSWPDLFLSKEDRHSGLEDFAAWAKQHPQDEYDGSLVTKSGEIRTILWSNSVLFSAHSDDLTAIAVGHDVTERRQAEEALRTSEHRYSLAAEAAKVGVWDWDLQTGDFYLDPRLKANLGYADHEIPNDIEVWTSYVHPDDLKPVMEAAQAHIDGLTPEYIYEHRMLHKDGSVRWILVRGKAVRNADGEVVRMVGTDTDITDRKVAEQKAERAHFELNQIFEAATPMNVIDTDFNMLRINDTFAGLFQVKSKDVIGKKCYDLWPGPLCRTSECPLERILSGREHQEYEDVVELPDGTVITSIVSALPYRGPDGEILGIVESFTDISARKRAEEALRISEEKFRELADLLPQTVFEVDRTGDLTFANRHGFESTGYTLDDFEKGLNILQMFAADDRSRIADRIPKLLEGEVFGGTEYSLIRKDGTSIPVIIYSSRIFRGGEVVGIRGIVIDITERKKAETELRIAYEKLKDEQRRLVEKHIALREVLGQIEGEKKETKLQIQANMERLVLPILSTLNAAAGAEEKVHLELLEKSLEDVTAPFVRNLEASISRLTPREIQICSMIKEGLRSKEIASTLNISVLTVHQFRQQIRKKLRISKKKTNLVSYLRSI